MKFKKGFESGAYKSVKVTIRGQPIVVKLHVLNYWVAKDFPRDFDLTKDISHLCHERSCVKFLHLNQETRSVNNSRKNCSKALECCGHDPEPNCVFWNHCLWLLSLCGSKLCLLCDAYSRFTLPYQLAALLHACWTLIWIQLNSVCTHHSFWPSSIFVQFARISICIHNQLPLCTGEANVRKQT